MPDSNSGEYRGQPITTGSGSGLRTNTSTARATSLTRESLGDLFGQNTGRSQLWDAIGYPREQELTFDTFWTRYRRTGPGHGIIEKFPSDTWQDFPEITDESDTEGETDFEKAVEELFGQPESYHSRKSLRKTPKHWLKTADKLATLGEYSVILLGVSDDKSPEEPIQGFEDGELDRESENKPFSGLDDLKFVGAYSQNEIEDFEVDTDITSETFRLPTEYEIKYSDEEDDETFHFSRVIHVPEGVLTDPLRGTPGQLPILHELLNIDKILAASAEGYWRGAYQGLIVKPPTNKDGVPLQFTDLSSGPLDSSGIEKQLRGYYQNYDRTIMSTGDIEQLDSSIASPKDHLEAQYRSISNAKDAPSSILMGNETGERATQEDREMWHELIGGRRNNFAEPVILRPFLDRLIAIGILPEPDGDGYEVEWPPLAEPSAAEEAEIKNVLSQAIDRISGGDPSSIFTLAERRKILDYDPEYGSEVDEDVPQPDKERRDAERALPPEDVDEQIQEQVTEYDDRLGPEQEADD